MKCNEINKLNCIQSSGKKLCSWRSPIGLTQSDLMTSLSHGTADWLSPVSVDNELAAQHPNI